MLRGLKGMMQGKKLAGLVAVLVISLISVSNVIRDRDAEIQSDRELGTRLVRTYEEKVMKADDELRALESQAIAFDDLEMISRLQTKALNTSRTLIGLAPVMTPILKDPNRLNTLSRASADSFMEHARAYDVNIAAYQSQMSELNRIVERANKQYVIKVIKPSYLDRASLSSRRKFAEIIGLSRPPEIAPSSRIDEINKKIAERSDKQKAIRAKWNTQAGKINETNRSVNSGLNEVYKLFKAPKSGIRIERAADLKTVN